MDLPYDIIIMIGKFLQPNDKIALMRTNKFIHNYAYEFLTTEQQVNSAVIRKEIRMIKTLMENNKNHKQIFNLLTKNSSIDIFSELNVNVFNDLMKQTMLIAICINNSVKILEIYKEKFIDISIDVTYIKNAFDKKFYNIINIMFSLQWVRDYGITYILIQSCKLGMKDIVIDMLANHNINRQHFLNDPFHNCLINAIECEKYDIVILLLNDRRVDPQINYYWPFRHSLMTNNKILMKILLDHERVNINNINITNIIYIMKDKELFEYILSLDKIDSTFINTCIHTSALNHIPYYITKLISHPKFNPTHLLFDEYCLLNITHNHYIFYTMFVYPMKNDDLKNILLEFIYGKINNNNYYHNFISLLSYIVELIEDKNIIIDKINNIINDKPCDQNKQATIFKILTNDSIYKNFNDAYDYGNYNMCKSYIASGKINMKILMNNFYKGKYSKLGKLFLSYY
jgi:hypothetical protein